MNALGGISHCSIMAVGFMEDVSTKEVHLIASCLNDRISGQVHLIADNPTGAYIHLGLVAYWVVANEACTIHPQKNP